MTAKSDELPSASRLYAYMEEGDFMDCFSAPILHKEQSIDDLARGARMKMPKWAVPLLALRNILVIPLGLKTTFAGEQSVGGKVEPGQLIDFFRVYERYENEIILGDDDKHLDYRVSVYRCQDNQDRLYLATWVRRNNWLGHVYLALVLPFHKMIVKAIASNIAQQKAAP